MTPPMLSSCHLISSTFFAISKPLSKHDESAEF
jgi:hypothetical protein